MLCPGLHGIMYIHKVCGFITRLCSPILPLVECSLHASPRKSKKPGVMFRVCIFRCVVLGGTFSHPFSLSYVIFCSQLRTFGKKYLIYMRGERQIWIRLLSERCIKQRHVPHCTVFYNEDDGVKIHILDAFSFHYEVYGSAFCDFSNEMSKCSAVFCPYYKSPVFLSRVRCHLHGYIFILL